MPRVEVVFYQEDDGTVPLLEWLDRLPAKVQAKCRVQIERLREQGHALHRPAAENLGEGIYELRMRWQSVNYRMLYFFHGRLAAVLSHGLTKERRVPPGEIAQAKMRKSKFEAHPEVHTYKEV
jgi:phage-related protein